MLTKRSRALFLTVLMLGGASAAWAAPAIAGSDATTDDPFEPNDSFDSAASISEGEYNPVIENGSVDFFELDLNDTEVLDVRLTPQSTDIGFRIYDPNREELVSDTFVPSGDTNRLTKALPSNGTYYIEVIGDNEVSTDYTLDVDVVVPSENDEFAPNSGFDSAAGLSEGFTDAKVWGGENDFYRIEANSTDALDVRLTPESTDIGFRIYDPNRAELVSDTFVPSGDTNRLTKALPSNGTYYIEVIGDGQTTTNYTLDVDVVVPSENDEFAPNSGFDSAAELSEGFTDAKVWGGENDFYRIEANSTDALDVGLTPESADIGFRIYGPNRQQIVEDGFVPSGDTNTLTAALPSTGTYYVEVFAGGQTTTEYRLNTEVVTPSENDEFAPNSDFESAAGLTQEFNDGTIWGGEKDFFKVRLSQGEGLNVALTPQDTDSALHVYGPDRSEVASDGFIPSGERQALTVQASESGLYYVRVTSNDPYGNTAYTLQTNRTYEPLGSLDVSLSTENVTVGETTEVAVNVTDAATGDPVEGATVAISDLVLSDTTNASGVATLSVDAPSAGGYPVSVSADGYADASSTLTVETDSSGPDVSGVSPDVSSAVAGSDGVIDADDVRGAVRAYFANDGTIDGVAITDDDIRSIVRYYFQQ